MKNWVYYNRSGARVLDFNPVVFISAILLIVALVVLSLLFLENVSSSANALQSWIADHSGWFFVLTVNVLLFYAVYLLFSSFGSIRLGGAEAKPEFGYVSWFAMLFSAGMGIGLMFYSVGEPVFHLVNPPHGAAAGSLAAYKDAMKTTYLHWGLHTWAIYALTALALAYFAFNRGQPLSIRAIFYPLLGAGIHRWPGHLIDTVATVATLFGVATSLGLGVTQINAGLAHIFTLPNSATMQVILITIITLAATLSVVLGLDKGIRRLSVLNMGFAALLLTFVAVVGPTLFILNGFVENIGLYLDDFFLLGFWNETYSQGNWQNSWTVFYWAWWISWAPFVGMFVARISRGRTIREFIGGVLLGATLMTFLWLSVFGDTALFMYSTGVTELADVAQEDISRTLFVFLDQLPGVTGIDFTSAGSTVLGLLATLVIVCFFITSSDSGSLVIDIITAGGRTEPPVVQRIFWATTEGVVAAILLMGGGLTALQTATITAGLPFAIVLLVMMVSLHKALSEDLI